MNFEELQAQSPIVYNRLDLFKGMRYAIWAQAEFFKTRTFILDVLNEREVKVLKLRYGIDNGQCLTQEKISEQMGVSRERVRQIEQRAYEKLNNPVCIEWLMTYTNDTFDKRLLETLFGNYDSLIRKDIVRTINENSLQIIQDVSIVDLDIDFGKGEQKNQKLKEKLKQKGIYSCSDLIKCLKTYQNFKDMGLSYSEYKTLFVSICDLIDRGDIKITSQESMDVYSSHKEVKQLRSQEHKSKLDEIKKLFKQQKTLQGKSRKQQLKRILELSETVLIEDFNFSVRPYHFLKSAGINTLADLIRYNDFTSIRELGEKSIKEILSNLNKNGIDLLSIMQQIQKNKLLTLSLMPDQVLIEDLQLSTRSCNALKKVEINTLYDMITTDIDFESIPSLGKKSVHEIYNTMWKLGLDIYADNYTMGSDR